MELEVLMAGFRRAQKPRELGWPVVEAFSVTLQRFLPQRESCDLITSEVDKERELECQRQVDRSAHVAAYQQTQLFQLIKYLSASLSTLKRVFSPLWLCFPNEAPAPVWYRECHLEPGRHTDSPGCPELPTQNLHFTAR